jgi:hypothetical protein
MYQTYACHLEYTSADDNVDYARLVLSGSTITESIASYRR